LNAGLQYGTQLANGVSVTARADWALKSGVHWSLGNHNDEQDSVSVVNARVIVDYERFGLAVYASNLFDRRYYNRSPDARVRLDQSDARGVLRTAAPIRRRADLPVLEGAVR